MDFDPLCRFLYFCGQSVVSVIMIDGSKKHKSLAGVEVQSPYVIERRSNREKGRTIKPAVKAGTPRKRFSLLHICSPVLFECFKRKS